jgi:thiamine pyrophosphate-dependent acetolactate synthase large subunit-like protein
MTTPRNEDKMTSEMNRREAVEALLDDRGDLLVVTGLGSASYDVHACGDAETNFYLWGAMGSAALVGLGLAQAQPERRVLVITGDGEQLMGLGGLATIAAAAPKNLAIAVIDNGHFGETGMQLSHTGKGLRLAKIATACGFAEVADVDDIESVRRIRKRMHETVAGPCFFVLKVKPENLPRSLPPRDAVHVKNRFRAALGFPTI